MHRVITMHAGTPVPDGQTDSTAMILLKHPKIFLMPQKDQHN